MNSSYHVLLPIYHASFSQSHKVGNYANIANFVFGYIRSFLFYFAQTDVIKCEIRNQRGV